MRKLDLSSFNQLVDAGEGEDRFGKLKGGQGEKRLYAKSGFPDNLISQWEFPTFPSWEQNSHLSIIQG